ncbi:MAG: molecular chaperone [Lachnospiraceae bacterium]|nr:molecular chaperone [Lachnospiraceae bacterium]
MEDIRAQQIEALEVLEDYNKRLMKSMQNIIPELEGDRKKDTDKFLDEIIKGINWEIGILNGTMTLLNEKKERIRKEDMNSSILKLSKALEGKKDSEIAASLKETLPVFEEFGKAAGEVLEEVK